MINVQQYFSKFVTSFIIQRVKDEQSWEKVRLSSTAVWETLTTNYVVMLNETRPTQHQEQLSQLHLTVIIILVTGQCVGICVLFSDLTWYHTWITCQIVGIQNICSTVLDISSFQTVSWWRLISYTITHGSVFCDIAGLLWYKKQIIPYY